MNLNETLNEKLKEAEELISKNLPQEDGYLKGIADMMSYAVSAGGKRLRPIILLESCRLYSDKDECAKYFAVALELIHNYSLVHDDLPCMDNDSLRRGKPSVWAKYGECSAVLCGDGLLNYAAEVAAKAFNKCDTIDEYKACAKAIEVLFNKSGIYGMIGGQVIDTDVDKGKAKMDEETLSYIHKNKTGALIEAAFMCGAILGKAPEADVLKLSEVALKVGLAFQIRDDILDVIGDEKALGKPIGSDEKNEKLTYVAMHGLEESNRVVQKLSEEAILILKSLNRDTEFLEKVINNLVGRDR